MATMPAMAMSAAETHLRNARVHAMQRSTFFISILMKLQPVESGGVTSFAVDGKHLFFNPEYVLNADPSHVQTSLAHEALHCALCHHTRRGGRDLQKWNEACDYVVNLILRDCGFHMRDGVLIDDQYKGMTAEEVYARRQQQSADQGGDEGDDANDDQDGDDEQTDRGDGQDESDEGGEDGQQGADEEGEGRGDARLPDIGHMGCFVDPPAEDETELEQQDTEWRIALAAAIDGAEAGDVPGSMGRQIQALLEPKMPWRELLRRYMDQFAREDYTWQRPNRRFVGGGLYLPSMHSEAIGRVLWVVDASGSMPVPAMQAAGNEVQFICRDLNLDVDVLVHDHGVRFCRTFEAGETIDVDVVAGGGTAFAPVLDYVRNADEPYAVVIWFTDMEAWDWHACSDPGVPVLWLDWTGRNADNATFGDDVIAVTDY